MKYAIEIYSRLQSAFSFVAANARAKGMEAYMATNMQLYSRGDSSFADMTLKTAGGIEFVFKNPEPIERKEGLFDALRSEFHPITDNAIEGVIAPPPMVSFSRTKNITKTVIDNSDFEVIENFGLKSWSIKIQGIVVDMENHWYPTDLESKICDLFAENGILEVTGDLFFNKGIRSLYVEDLEVAPVEGYNDTIKFTLQAYSINPVEFSII